MFPFLTTLKAFFLSDQVSDGPGMGSYGPAVQFASRTICQRFASEYVLQQENGIQNVDVAVAIRPQTCELKPDVSAKDTSLQGT